MNREAINTLLFRNIKKGTEYNTLMPSGDGNIIDFADGNTEVVINKMAQWSYKFQHQTQALTNHLFKNLSLSKLCEELHSFLFHHLQYKIDDYTQKLRSPARSWSDRQKGIDCKSYSIFASTVLLNRGIIHYLRRVTINKGEGYSHVYVVVPKNQNTGNLKGGYFVIDGTINTLQEQTVYKTDDVKMTPHTGLNKGNPKISIAEKALDAFMPLIKEGVNSFIEHLNSCSDSRFDKGVVSLRIKRDLQTVLQNKIQLLDEAIEISNDARTQNLFNELLKEVDLGIAHLRSETAYNTYDECALEVLTEALVFAEKLKEYIDSYLNNFIKTQLRFAVSVKKHNALTNDRTYYFVVEPEDNPILAEYRQISIAKKPSLYDVDPVVPYGKDTNHWLIENKSHFSKNYNSTVARNYENEVRPYLVHIKALRDKGDFMDAETLYYYEKPHRRNLYNIFIKFDQKFADLIKQQNKNLQIANLKTIQHYKNEIEQSVAEDQKAKNRKKLKQQIGYGLAGLVVLYFIFKKRK
ncbi:hypothetical protein SAMN04489761_4659 [Tenacibaculum sp. MAR_2009_124]|uniref:hypothetical protein n=1 Tax=Tenacibaculum sp. MAR_2009_124 TaxID=1250059 RepID=UPI000899078A|nr:hypothetical protein [Tenacibaculum sp. MAR_2009_124]SED21779.1 hypothetical protein SAMN04489761_4659 [Tenacibaculum sp. MAR_2009_124]